MRALVAVEGESTTRAAHSLSDHPAIDAVALLAPATSGSFETVDTAAGFDVVVGRRVAAETAHQAGLPAVVVDTLDAGAVGVYGASLKGLALALAAGMSGSPLVAVAVEGDPGGDRPLLFPSPIDSRAATAEDLDGHRLWVAPGPGPLQAAMAQGPHRHRVVLDDSRFLEAIALAAGVGVLLEEMVGGPVPVWERASSYLRTAAEMGLVIGERPAA